MATVNFVAVIFSQICTEHHNSLLTTCNIVFITRKELYICFAYLVLCCQYW